MTATRPPANRLMSDEMFDNSQGYDDETGIRLPDGLSDEERQQAVTLYRLFNELWGLALIVGDPGTGKDLFGNYICYKIKKYFPWKRILRDERPRKLFGPYAGLFNEEVIRADLEKMKAIAKGEVGRGLDDRLTAAADDWVKGAGEVLLKNSVLYLTEYWRYCYKREPHNPMNKTMGAIHKVKRHLDNLCFGTVQQVEDLDVYTSLPWVDWQITSTRSVHNPTGFCYYVTRVHWDRRHRILVPTASPFPIAFDAGKPRSDLGDGRIVVVKYNYRPATEEERVVLNCLRAGIDRYEDLVEFLETEGDMIESEILSTLKELKFRKSKRAIDYPCYFGLYNSKSAVQVNSRLKMSE